MENKTVKLEKYAQVVSIDLLACLKDAATAKDVSVDMEVALRLMANLVGEGVGQNPKLSEKILKQQFSGSAAVAECKQKRDSWLYLYEIEKLKLFLQFEGKVPRKFKEGFTLIDVKSETKRILVELQKAKQAKRKGE